MVTELINDKLLTQIGLEITDWANIIESPSSDCWFIELKEYDFLGFISCEDNMEDLKFPTISIGLFVYDITGISREQLFDLFALNGELHACSLSVESFEDRWKLILNRRIMVESYQPGELGANIMVMLNRLSIFQDKIDRILRKVWDHIEQ
jgi:hypothetical protein